jgi:RND family efflux transporter MFP subunit
MAAFTRWLVPLVAAGVLLGGGWALRAARQEEAAPAGSSGTRGPVAVEAVAVEHGAIEQRRELSGTLEATAEIVVAPKVGGRLDRITVDLGDAVRPGQVVAELDDEELAQAQAQTKADLAVAQARKVAADNALAIAERNHHRVAGLRARGIVTEEELDAVEAAKLQADADLAVAASEITRARAALRGAEVRKGYTQVIVDWSDGTHERVVAARHVDDGTMVAANTPLLSVVGLDPLVVAVYVTEQDYARLRAGQAVALATDAYPGEEFTGHVARIAPVFAPESRQARVELEVPNPDGRLRPGMYVRARVVLARIEAAAIVPRAALVPQEAGHAVYVVAGGIARLVPVTVGVSDGERVQVDGLEGIEQVITLGQARLHDGAEIVLPEPEAELEPGAEGAAS